MLLHNISFLGKHKESAAIQYYFIPFMEWGLGKRKAGDCKKGKVERYT